MLSAERDTALKNFSKKKIKIFSKKVSPFPIFGVYISERHFSRRKETRMEE